MLIRLLKTHEECHEGVKIQKAVWKFPDLEAVPVNELIVTQKIGGAVFGAFDKGRMVGFCFCVPAFDGREHYHHSRMLGVLPQYQNTGLGFRLKLAQRRFALDRGVRMIQWTFDPLQSRNAYFNISKLGCVIKTYWVNLYGASRSAFNRGLETDRFAPEWRIATRRVRARLDGKVRPTKVRDDEIMNITAPTRNGFRQTVRIRKTFPARRCAVEVPSNIDTLKAMDLNLARGWRRVTRRLFVSAFKSGWTVTDFALRRDPGGLRSFYVLEKT